MSLRAYAFIRDEIKLVTELLRVSIIYFLDILFMRDYIKADTRTVSTSYIVIL